MKHVYFVCSKQATMHTHSTLAISYFVVKRRKKGCVYCRSICLSINPIVHVCKYLYIVYQLDLSKYPRRINPYVNILYILYQHMQIVIFIEARNQRAYQASLVLSPLKAMDIAIKNIF